MIIESQQEDITKLQIEVGNLKEYVRAKEKQYSDSLDEIEVLQKLLKSAELVKVDLQQTQVILNDRVWGNDILNITLRTKSYLV